MKVSPILLAMLVAFNAQAECIMRTSATTKVEGKIDSIADIRPIVTPTADGKRKCSINARVEYKNNWYTIMDTYEDTPTDNDEELCYKAIELGVRRFLATVEAKTLQSEEQMFCTDEPEIKVKPVEKGDIIRQSQVAPHPVKKGEFQYKGATCKWFAETTVSSDNLYQWQGIICRVGNPDDDRWSVVDRF